MLRLTSRPRRDQASRAISTARLKRSRALHLPPINVVVSHGPSGVSRPGSVHLGEGFPLRCIQRLSPRDIANRRCPWQDSRDTRGRFSSDCGARWRDYSLRRPRNKKPAPMCWSGLRVRSWRRPTLPPPRKGSTIGADRLNDHVRDGNGDNPDSGCSYCPAPPSVHRPACRRALPSNRLIERATRLVFGTFRPEQAEQVTARAGAVRG